MRYETQDKLASHGRLETQTAFASHNLYETHPLFAFWRHCMKEKEQPVCAECKKPAHHIHHIDGNHKNDKKENLQWLCTLCHSKVHGISPKQSELKEHVVVRDRALKIRNALNNQTRGFSRIELLIPKAWEDNQKNWNAIIRGEEKAIKALMQNGNFKAWGWLQKVKGISHVTAGKLMAYIDINKTPSVSALWRYCGLDATHVKRTRAGFKGVKDKAAEAKKFGNPYLKKEIMGILADSFIRQRTPVYREIYDREKERQLHLMSQTGIETHSCIASHVKPETHVKLASQAVHETQRNSASQQPVETQVKCASHVRCETHTVSASIPKNKMHCHLRAKRKMVKIFLQNFWEAWRTIEGLQVTQPYVEARLGHKNIIRAVVLSPHKERQERQAAEAGVGELTLSVRAGGAQEKRNSTSYRVSPELPKQAHGKRPPAPEKTNERRGEKKDDIF